MFLSKAKQNKQIISWSFYDFANQPYTTLIITFIYSAFFVNYIAPNEIEGTFLWANAISITAIIVAFLSPLLGAFADETGYRKFFLVFFTLLCSLFTALLYFPEKGDLSLAISFVIISNIAFEMGCVFCNSYLKELSNDKNIGRVSGNAWGLGFLGGLSALFISFVLFESSAAGLPFVSIDVGNAREIANWTGSGFVFSNIKKLSVQLDNLILNKQKQEKLSKNGIRKIKNEYNWKKISLKYLQTFKNYNNK